ncbi:MAG: hypothetical protein AAF637_21815 [Pseudomonadota bacterium]
MMRLPIFAAVLSVAIGASAQAQESDMSFFITSIGSGNGGDLGGLEGADALCQQLGGAEGADGKTWRSYLSTQEDGDQPAVNARDRIGGGPWQNALGIEIAANVDELHGDNNLIKETALNERGEEVNGRGDSPNRHQILTGSQADGTAFPAGEDRTCSNWTSSGEGSAFVGHHDRIGLADDAASRSWNSSEASRGCSQEALIGTGGDGLIYCFAAN